jgi:hypothetical protein
LQEIALHASASNTAALSDCTTASKVLQLPSSMQARGELASALPGDCLLVQVAHTSAADPHHPTRQVRAEGEAAALREELGALSALASSQHQQPAGLAGSSAVGGGGRPSFEQQAAALSARMSSLGGAGEGGYPLPLSPSSSSALASQHQQQLRSLRAARESAEAAAAQANELLEGERSRAAALLTGLQVVGRRVPVGRLLSGRTDG